MVSFDFQPRTRVLFGPGSITRVGQIARQLGFRRTLVVADPGIRQAGHTNRVLDALTAEAEKAIDLLQERRTAIISAAVTGKIDVRGLTETEAA